MARGEYYYTGSDTSSSGNFWSNTVATTTARTWEDEYIRAMQGAVMSSRFLRSPEPQKDGKTVLKLIKKSIKDIETEPFDGEARKKIENKINRLKKVGVVAQAVIVENELKLRSSLIRLKEWDYKILSKEAVGRFENEHRMTATRDGLRIHIDPLESYCGNPKVGEAKDRLIPDEVLEKLEEAQERQLFDSFAVLWAEKVKDPLLLGCIDGCEDYFFIAEWGEDISFDELTKK